MPQTLDDDALRREAAHLHRAFFGGDPPPEVAARYVAACRACLSGADPREERAVAEVVRLRLDPEAVEFALRLRGKRLLTKKIQALFYLCEVRKDYLGHFFNTGEPRPAAILRLAGALATAAFKAAKGFVLVARHRLG
mgnify:CR=1 FL=1